MMTLAIVQDEMVVGDRTITMARRFYWVRSGLGEQASWWGWKWSTSMPSGPGWRHPSYAEIVERQRQYDVDPSHFQRLVSR